jgi:hypothetical protein
MVGRHLIPGPYLVGDFVALWHWRFSAKSLKSLALPRGIEPYFSLEWAPTANGSSAIGGDTYTQSGPAFNNVLEGQEPKACDGFILS